MAENIRKIYFISDGTGITVETLGQSLLTQFGSLEYTSKKYPYIDTIEKAEKISQEINQETINTKLKPIILSTLISEDIRNTIKKSANKCLVLDFFEQYINPLEQELNLSSDHTIGKSHSLTNLHKYDSRIDAINFALSTDDGLSQKKYSKADIILIGVSRSGKTPTCLYMAMKYGIKAANYPLVEEDLEQHTLPELLKPFQNKLYGLSIDPKRLQSIRQKRRPDTKYASIKKCRDEIKLAEQLFLLHDIPFLYTTTHSIEEITAHIIADKQIDKLIK